METRPEKNNVFFWALLNYLSHPAPPLPNLSNLTVSNFFFFKFGHLVFWYLVIQAGASPFHHYQAMPERKPFWRDVFLTCSKQIISAEISEQC